MLRCSATSEANTRIQSAKFIILDVKFRFTCGELNLHSKLQKHITDCRAKCMATNM